jgi:hypothetical protein
MSEFENIVAIRYLKETGEFVITTRNETTGKQSKTYTNNLTNTERTWAKESKHCFEDPMSICWTN